MRLAFYRAWTSSWREGWQDRLVSIFTLGRYSHVEFVFSDGMCFSASPRDGGTRFKEIHFVPGRWTFVDIPDCNEDALWKWCSVQQGRAYDWLGLLSPWFGCQDPYRWFCSEIVAAGLNAVANTNLSTRCSPSRLYRLLA